MLNKTYKVEAKHQQFLNKEPKRRFDMSFGQQRPLQSKGTHSM
jgi:peptide methionine sulfoxide reductase MsrA